MKKNIFTLSILFILAFCFSCSNGLNLSEGQNSCSQKGSGKVSINVELANSNQTESSRTVLPSAENTKTLFNEIKLTGSGDNLGLNISKTWKSLDAIDVSDLILDEGDWTFTLTASMKYNNTKTYSFSQTINVTVEEGEDTVLNFNQMESTFTADYGLLYISYVLTNDLGVTKIEASLDNGTAEELKISAGTSISAVTFVKDVTPGEHKVTFTWYKDSTVERKYSIYAHVQKGYASKAAGASVSSEIEVKYNVTYNINDSGSSSANYVQKGYSSTSGLLSPEQAGFTAPEGKRFLCWSKLSSDNSVSAPSFSSSSSNDYFAFLPEDTPVFTSDTTLYAHWCDEDEYRVILPCKDGTGNVNNYIFATSSQKIDLSNFKDKFLSLYSPNQQYLLCWTTEEAVKSDSVWYENTISNLALTEDTTLYPQTLKAVNSSYTLTIASLEDLKKLYLFPAVYNKAVTDFLSKSNGSLSITSSLIIGSELISKMSETTVNFTISGNDNTLTTYSTKPLFKEIASGASVKNLKIEPVYLTSPAIITLDNKGTISDVTISDNLLTYKKIAATTSQNVGLIASLNEKGATIDKCTVDVTGVSVSGSPAVGAVAGKNEGTIKRCTVSGSITASNTTSTASCNLGGVCGQNVNDVLYCNSDISLTSSLANLNLGGIVGYNTYDSTLSTIGCVEYCMQWGDLSATTTVTIASENNNTNVGGIIGKSVQKSDETEALKYCASAAKIKGGNYAGGLIGYNEKTEALYSYALLQQPSYITSVGQGKVGGLFGIEATGGDGEEGWTQCFSYKTNMTSGTLNCVAYSKGKSGPRNGSGLNTDYNVTAPSDFLTKINKATTAWSSKSSALTSLLPYEVTWPTN